MKTNKLVKVLIVVSVILLFAGLGLAQSKKTDIQIGEIANKRVIDTSSGIYYGLTLDDLQNENYIFFEANYRNGKPDAWMNIDGKDVKLKEISSTSNDGPNVKNPYFISTFKSGNITVKVNMRKRFTSDGPATDYFYIATITIIKGKNKKVVKGFGNGGSDWYVK